MNLITQKNTGNTLWNDLLGSPGQAQVGGTAYCYLVDGQATGTTF